MIWLRETAEPIRKCDTCGYWGEELEATTMKRGISGSLKLYCPPSSRNIRILGDQEPIRLGDDDIAAMRPSRLRFFTVGLAQSEVRGAGSIRTATNIQLSRRRRVMSESSSWWPQNNASVSYGAVGSVEEFHIRAARRKWTNIKARNSVPAGTSSRYASLSMQGSRSHTRVPRDERADGLAKNDQFHGLSGLSVNM